MAFYAKSGNNYFHIFSKQSPRLIVRSQNPGFYGDTTFAYMGVMPVPGVVPGVVPGSVVPEATIKTAGRTGSVTGGVGIAGAAPVGISGGTVPNMVGSDSPSGEKQDGSSLPPLVGVKRNASEEYGDNSYQVPTNNFDSATNTETLNAMNFDSASETDYLLNRSAQEGWKKREGEGSMVYKGKVGINVANPSEALTVKGNVLVHGDVFKPSDMRIKSEITPVESGEQLAHIRELKLYDYTVNQKKERGVLAQELQQVMPNAVREVGDVVVDSKVIKNMLTVNERALLYENIGATKQLDKEVESGKQTIVHINTKVDDLAVSTRAHNDSVQGTVQSMFALFFQEEDKKGTHNGLEEEFVSFGFSLFRMGPARTLLVLGHFIPWIWFIGAMFTFSNLIRRRVLGCICLFLFACFFTLLACQYFGSVDNIDTILIRARIAWAGVGAVLLIVNYFRLRRKLEQAALSKRS